jgi:hypothetical protein
MIVLSISSCNWKKSLKTDEKPLAKVGEEYLYPSSLFSLTRGLSPKDSARLVKDYAESWTRKKLLTAKALNYIDAEKSQIYQKTEDFKNSLVLYEYEKALIGEKLDTSVSEQELMDYYTKNQQAFRLTSDITHVYYVKLKSDAPDLDKFRKWTRKKLSESEFLQFEGYCEAYAGSFDISKGSWMSAEEFTQRFPLDKSSMDALEIKNGFREFKMQNEIWFIKSDNSLQSGDYAPLEYVRKNVLDLILNKRKVALIEKTYERILKDGMESGNAEIYIR